MPNRTIATRSQDEQVILSIARFKKGRAAQAGQPLEPAIGALLERSAEAVVAGTETSMARDAIASPMFSLHKFHAGP